MAFRLFHLRGSLHAQPDGAFTIEGTAYGEVDDLLGPGGARIRPDGSLTLWWTRDQREHREHDFGPAFIVPHLRPSREALVGLPEPVVIVTDGGRVVAASGCIFHLARELPLAGGATLTRLKIEKRWKPGYRPPDADEFREEFEKKPYSGWSASTAYEFDLYRNTDVVHVLEWRLGADVQQFALREGEHWERQGTSLTVTKAWLPEPHAVGFQHLFQLDLAVDPSGTGSR